MTRPDPARDEFYVGYLNESPPGIAKIVKRAVVGLYLAAGVLATVLIVSHGPFEPATYEFGRTRVFRGVLRAEPYPTLEVSRPADASSRSQYLLVDQGKFGAQQASRPFEGQRVELEGSLVYRQGQTMVEVIPDSIELLAQTAAGAAPRLEELGKHSLVGEIVDSKCFLGVMNPGRLKTHKACAIRCISGGIPPLFHVASDARGTLQFLLVSETGEAVNSEVLDFVAEPIEITGRVTKYGDLFLLWADPTSYERVSGE